MQAGTPACIFLFASLNFSRGTLELTSDGQILLQGRGISFPSWLFLVRTDRSCAIHENNRSIAHCTYSRKSN